MKACGARCSLALLTLVLLTGCPSADPSAGSPAIVEEPLPQFVRLFDVRAVSEPADEIAWDSNTADPEVVVFQESHVVGCHHVPPAGAGLPVPAADYAGLVRNCTTPGDNHTIGSYPVTNWS